MARNRESDRDGWRKQLRGSNVNAGRFARLTSANHKSLMLLPMLKVIMLKVDTGSLHEVGAISRQEVNTKRKREREKEKKASVH